jgi:hypothetical protein
MGATRSVVSEAMFGLGPRNPQLRVIRLGILVLVILAGVVFHHQGSTYDAIRVGYYVVLVAFIGYAFSARSRAKRGGGPMGPAGQGPSPTFPGHPGDPSSTVPVPTGPTPSPRRLPARRLRSRRPGGIPTSRI